ncbi:glyoxalase/bleomycin resistance/extradiol dioxygenase family protein [Actinopolymorpha sp. B17G11]|uniref:VOC family protein n=1 Tax=unclassified Actinopolymorpha TaxID=2627063 RepID=UPI0032D8F3EF
MRMIFVNLPVTDLKASTDFFTTLGFEFNPQFSDDKCACMVVDQNIFVMLLVEERFKDFINGEICDPARTEVITCLSAESRQQVDDTLAAALAAGGKPWQPMIEDGPMYGASFCDLDGHVWELMHMDLGSV